MTSPADLSFPIRPYSPDSRIDEVESRIKEYINDNQIGEGQQLPGESWFATQLEVGRPLVREAMRRLEAVGLIEVRRGIGRFVREFDPEAYLSHYTTQMLISRFSERELVETRCSLEITMAVDAVHRLGDDDLEKISELWREMQDLAARGESNPAVDLALHRVIVSRADNRLIVSILDAVLALSFRRLEQKEHSKENIQEDLKEHEAIVRAALARDGDGVRAALITHFSTTASRLGFGQRWQSLFSPAVTS